MKTALILFWITLNIHACHKEQTLFVADHYATSEKSAEKYLLVKPSENDEWTQLMCPIEGFDYQEGFTYQIKVKTSKNKKDTSCPLKYKLIEVVSKTPSVRQEPESSHTLIGDWEVTEIQNTENQTGVKPFFKITENFINGNNGCNTFGGKVVIQDESHVKFHQLVSTKMFCTETAKIEFAVMNAITHADSFTVQNGMLTLFDKEGVMLLKAIPQTEKVAQTDEQMQEQAFVIKYAKSTRGHISQWEYNGETIEVEQTRPEPVKKSIAVSKKDQAAIKSLVDKLDLDKLTTLTPPSTKHQFDGALVVNLDIIMGDQIYSVPAFDDGNPNAYIKELVVKLKKLAESK